MQAVLGKLNSRGLNEAQLKHLCQVSSTRYALFDYADIRLKVVGGSSGAKSKADLSLALARRLVEIKNQPRVKYVAGYDPGLASGLARVQLEYCGQGQGPRACHLVLQKWGLHEHGKVFGSDANGSLRALRNFLETSGIETDHLLTAPFIHHVVEEQPPGARRQQHAAAFTLAGAFQGLGGCSEFLLPDRVGRYWNLIPTVGSKSRRWSTKKKNAVRLVDHWMTYYAVSNPGTTPGTPLNLFKPLIWTPLQVNLEAVQAFGEAPKVMFVGAFRSLWERATPSQKHNLADALVLAVTWVHWREQGLELLREIGHPIA